MFSICLSLTSAGRILKSAPRTPVEHQVTLRAKRKCTKEDLFSETVQGSRQNAEDAREWHEQLLEERRKDREVQKDMQQLLGLQTQLLELIVN